MLHNTYLYNKKLTNITRYNRLRHLFDQSCVTNWQYISTRSRAFYMFWVWKPEGWVCGGVSYGSYAYFTHNSALRRLRKWLNFPFQLYVYSNPSKQSHLVKFIIHIALLESKRGGGGGVGKNWKMYMINAIFLLFYDFRYVVLLKRTT